MFNLYGNLRPLADLSVWEGEMADEPVVHQKGVTADADEDPVARARQIDALMAGPPATLPAIMVIGDEAVFGIWPIRRGG